jgi:hypothetical protein
MSLYFSHFPALDIELVCLGVSWINSRLENNIQRFPRINQMIWTMFCKNTCASSVAWIRLPVRVYVAGGGIFILPMGIIV